MSADEIKSIVLTKTEHQKFTILWRQAIGYKNSKNVLNTSTASYDDIMNAAKEIYKEYPDILKALNLN